MTSVTCGEVKTIISALLHHYNQVNDLIRLSIHQSHAPKHCYAWNNRTGKEISTMGDDHSRLLTCVSVPLAISGFVFYAVIICFGVSGNAFIIATVLRNSKLHTPFNYLVVNLAISDICVFVFSLPIVVFSECFAWPLGDSFCLFSRPLFYVFSGVSVATMVTLSFERYRAVATPLAPKLTYEVTKRLIVVIWVLSYIFIGLPKSFMYELSTVNGVLKCDPMYRTLTLHLFMNIWIFIFTLILPCTVVCWSYSRVMFTFRQHLQTIGRTCPSRDVTRSRAKRNAKMMRLLLTLVIVFVVCYLPFNVVVLLDLYSAFKKWQYNETAENMSRMLQVGHSCANPIILCLLSTEFRKALIEFFLKLDCNKTRESSENYNLQEIH